AAQPAAQAGDAARVHRHVLVLGHAQRDRLLVRREARAAPDRPTHATAAALARRLARAHLAHLDAAVHAAGAGPGHGAQLGALLGAVGERDARAVEADLGADRARVLDAALLEEVAEREHGLAAGRAVLLDARLVVGRGAPLDRPQSGVAR